MSRHDWDCSKFAGKYSEREGTSYVSDLFEADTGQELLNLLDEIRDRKSDKFHNWALIGHLLDKSENAFREGVISEWESDDEFEARGEWRLNHGGREFPERPEISAN